MSNKFTNLDMSNYSKDEIDQFYDKYGFIIIRNALTEQEADDLRLFIDKIYTERQFKNRVRDLNVRHLYEYPELYNLPFNAKIVAVLKKVLGDSFSIFPDQSVMRNSYGTGVKGGGWHIDAGSEIGQPYLFDPLYRFVKCGIYFQDNTYEWAGGIYIIPGSHHLPKFLGHKKAAFRLWNFIHWFQKKFNVVNLDTRKGDFVCFDSRLLHVGSWPNSLKLPESQCNQNFIKNIPEEHTKYVYYWDACRTQFADSFLANAVRRAESLYKSFTGNEDNIPQFLDYLRYTYPASFPPEFVKQAEKNNIVVTALDEMHAAQWREKSPLKEYANITT